LEKLTGKTWERTQVSSKEVLAPAQEKLSKGDYSAVPTLILYGVYGDHGWGDNRQISGGLWNDKLGLPKDDLETSLKTFLGA
jgi:hypothetical protein